MILLMEARTLLILLVFKQGWPRNHMIKTPHVSAGIVVAVENFEAFVAEAGRVV